MGKQIDLNIDKKCKVIYVYCKKDKKRAYDYIKSLNICYCVIDEDDCDLHKFSHMIESGLYNKDSDEITIYYLSSTPHLSNIIEQGYCKDDLSKMLDLSRCFTHCAHENDSGSFDIHTSDRCNDTLQNVILQKENKS